jgi:AcrR family transcriptional regulator
VNDPATPDRRVQRTRLGILMAFNSLVLERGYDAITVRDIIAHANVGRSTFYEHFANKDDLLRRSLRPVFGPLADVVRTAGATDELAEILAHFRENRRLLRVMLGGSTRRVLARILAELIEERLGAASPGAAYLVPVAMLAAQLADGQLGLIGAWLTAKPPCTRETLARALHASTNAAAAALASPNPREDRKNKPPAPSKYPSGETS